MEVLLLLEMQHSHVFPPTHMLSHIPFLDQQSRLPILYLSRTKNFSPLVLSHSSFLKSGMHLSQYKENPCNYLAPLNR